jgi:hypothetical protein
MSPFALRLRSLNAAAIGNESAFRQETDRSASTRSTQACRSAWIRSSRIVTWFQLAKARLTNLRFDQIGVALNLSGTKFRSSVSS